ncbi:hypothetical protein PTTG_08003 [Puccinia triticina 1-1 BBBD Race 1]|uniref:Uncharacterized protein n=1 Tax=Puccinia triticina (isolate 1-1 / race 1 (BBBD)) TaxID=630390 RepID=A0A0C4F4G3_PUCT1|nr:hypothetical protein PTTG_08003 [Puccinia triticina 1-1 BBBD Race 1]
MAMGTNGYPAPLGGYPAPLGGYPAPVGGYPAPVGRYPAPVGGYLFKCLVPAVVFWRVHRIKTPG